jgi:Mycothiol maleylpyruvate isomerase N-terminal domain
MQIETWTKERLLTVELEGHQALETVVARAGMARLDSPGACGSWSIKDVLAHIAFGQEWLAEQLELPARGEQPGRDEIAAMDPRLWEQESRNALVHEQSRGRELADVLEWWRQSWARCRAAHEALAESAYYRPHWWTQGWPLVRGLDPNHRLEHAKEISAWLGGGTS